MLDIVFSLIDGNAQPSGYTNDLTVTLRTPIIPGVNAAPASVWFEVDTVTGANAAPPSGAEVYDPQYHDIKYIWTFDDVANARPTTVLNIPERFKDINIGAGRRPAHVYNNPGVYTVTCTAYEPATRRYGTVAQQVTIGDPATVFPNDQTLVLDPTSGFSGLYPTGAQVETTWDAVESYVNSNQGRFYRVLLAPGVDITFDGQDRITPWLSGFDNFRLGALDPAQTRPILRKTGFNAVAGAFDSALLDDRGDNIECVLYNIDLIGEWDSVSETGRYARCYNGSKTGLSASIDHQTLFHRCMFSGWESSGKLLDVEAGSRNFHIFNDCHITNWQNYGILAGPGIDTTIDRFKFAAIGCSVAQDENARSGQSKNGVTNDHGPGRDFGCEYQYVSVCELFSRNGWSQGGSDNSFTPPLAVIADQPAWRFNTEGRPGNQMYMERVAMEGDISHSNVTGPSDSPGNSVYENIVQFAHPARNTTDFNFVRLGGTTMRNMVTIISPTPFRSDTVKLGNIGLFRVGSGDVASNGAAGVRVYNNTIIDLRDDGDLAGPNGGTFTTFSTYDNDPNEPFPVFIEENNVLHQPNRTDGGATIPGETIDVDDILDGMQPKHKGWLPSASWVFGFTVGNHNSGQNVLNGQSFEVPYSVILDGPADRNTGRSGNATDQAYWQANAGTDTKHMIRFDSVNYYADLSEISVNFTATGAQITNNSSVTWLASDAYLLKLDYTSRLLMSDTLADASAQTYTTAESTDPDTTTPPAGLIAYDDIKLGVRPEIGDRQGALTNNG